MPDDIRALTGVLARDPASLAYADLAEALRRRGQYEAALQVALQGLTRHPMHAAGHDTLARVYADLGDLERARLAWSKVLELVPDHAGALKGMAFVRYRRGDATGAATALEQVLAASPGDDAARRALESVRPVPSRPGAKDGRESASAPAPGTAPTPSPLPTPSPQAPGVFRGFDGAGEDLLLLDQRGLVLAGGITSSRGGDASELAAAALAGVSGEAARTAGYLALGSWHTIVAEAETANLVVAPVGEGALLLVRRDRASPVGLTLRFAERARSAALAWLAGQGA